MIKTSVLVEQKIVESDFIEFALNNNFLNLSKYAKFIKKDLEKQSFKKIKTGTIVVAISRIKKKLKKKKLIDPKYFISELSIKSPLCEIVFEKNPENTLLLKNVYDEANSVQNIFITVTQGSSEIMITTNSSLKDKILRHFKNQKTKAILNNLVGITIKFSTDVTNQPRIFYELLKGLAFENISVVDAVSTFSEFTMIVKADDSRKAFDIINNIYVSHQKI